MPPSCFQLINMIWHLELIELTCLSRELNIVNGLHLLKLAYISRGGPWAANSALLDRCIHVVNHYFFLILVSVRMSLLKNPFLSYSVGKIARWTPWVDMAFCSLLSSPLLGILLWQLIQDMVYPPSGKASPEVTLKSHPSQLKPMPSTF